ncbi:MAG: hypothetical protein AVDCRST_MAG08-2237, partial [uncultured Acetobacteraceae bacterium]
VDGRSAGLRRRPSDRQRPLQPTSLRARPKDRIFRGTGQREGREHRPGRRHQGRGGGGLPRQTASCVTCHRAGDHAPDRFERARRGRTRDPKGQSTAV